MQCLLLLLRFVIHLFSRETLYRSKASAYDNFGLFAIIIIVYVKHYDLKRGRLVIASCRLCVASGHSRVAFSHSSIASCYLSSASQTLLIATIFSLFI
jgi:hypothetical protein